MNSRKPLILIVAAVFALLSVFVLYSYVNGLRDKAFNNAQRVKVYIVRPGQTVSKGTYGQNTRNTIVQDEIPKQWYPPNAITSLDQIQNKVAVADFQSNQIIVQSNFVDPTQAGLFSLSTQLKQINKVDQVAVTVQVDQVRGVAGLIVPGDYVNIMATKIQQVGTNGGDTGGGAGGGCGANLPPNVNADNVLFCKQARYVFEKAEVLAVGQTSAPQPGQQPSSGSGSGANNAPPTTVAVGNTGLITFIVPARTAQYLASIPSENLYLTLVSKDFTPVPMTPIKVDDPLPAEDPQNLTPYGPSGPE